MGKIQWLIIKNPNRKEIIKDLVIFDHSKIIILRYFRFFIQTFDPDDLFKKKSFRIFLMGKPLKNSF